MTGASPLKIENARLYDSATPEKRMRVGKRSAATAMTVPAQIEPTTPAAENSASRLMLFCSAALKNGHRLFFETALLCQTLKEAERSGGRVLLGDPMEVALVRLARDFLGEVEPFPQVDEVPFDSDRRRLASLRRTPEGLVLHVKGALETLLRSPVFPRSELDFEVLDTKEQKALWAGH